MISLRFTTAADLCARVPEKTSWIARPWIAAGALTELDGKVKSAGKTTWIAALVRCVLEGAPFLGEPTTKTNVVWLTEQPSASFRQVLVRAGLEDRDDLLVLSWVSTRGKAWEDVATAAVAKAREFGAGLMVVDTIAQFAGVVEENSPGEMLRAVQPLQAGAQAGLGVLIAHHERKSGGRVGESGRGSSALPGAVDIVLRLFRPEGNHRPTVRQIESLSRFDETPETLMIELRGQTYVEHGNARQLAQEEATEQLLDLLPSTADDGLTLKAILEQLEGSKRATLQRALDDLLEKQLAATVGAGKRGDPRRFYRPENVSAQATLPHVEFGQIESLSGHGWGEVP